MLTKITEILCWLSKETAVVNHWLMFQLTEISMIVVPTKINRKHWIIFRRKQKIFRITIVDISRFWRDSIEFNRLYIAISFAIISLQKHTHNLWISKRFHQCSNRNGRTIVTSSFLESVKFYSTRKHLSFFLLLNFEINQNY